MGIAADWEVASDRKISNNALLRELNKLKAARQSSLDSRREELAQKLYREEETLRSELLNSKETPEERRAALATRAKALWEAREAERQAEASALLDRHFRCSQP
jgi:cilia- and flagella-associated protein 53